MTSPPPTDPPPSGAPGVVAVLVVTDGEEWLSSVLGTLAAQRYPALGLVVVDNASTDGSVALLDRRIPPERLVRLRRRVGYARAVAAAMAHGAVGAADMVLLLHDDMVLAPDAVERLVAALVQDPQVGIVGPKLRDWSEEPLLQEVGMTIDRFGRAENRLEPGELDQGQHDGQREVLYVSTAGMLVRGEVLRRLGGFDQRYVAMRDDLDLCWRAWLAGERVEVVPDAVGYHVAAGSRSLRPFMRPSTAAGRPSQAREYAERHAIATLLKCYALRHLLWVLPVVWVLGLGKVIGFVAARRFADAIAVIRAHLWNLAQMPRTLRRRRAVQRRRMRTDAEVLRLFAPGLPRIRSYSEALGDWLAGGSTRALLEEEAPDPTQVEGGAALTRFVRRHPAGAAAIVLLAVYLVGLVPLLGPGQLIGGEVAPWPETARTFLRRYASPWNGEPAATAGFASPIQALLGFASFIGFGSAWLAQRLLVLGLVPLAWFLALKAGRLLTSRRLPRVLGATLYVVSPVLLGALAHGRWSALVVGALLPGVVYVAARAVQPGLDPAPAWRAAALLALLLAATVAAAPTLWPLPAAVVLVGAVLAVLGGDPVPALRRLLMASAAAVGLIAPWLYSTVRLDELPLETAAASVELPLWRALLAVPATLPGMTGAGVLLPAATAAAVIGVGLIIGLRVRPTVAVGLLAAVVVSASAAWLIVRLGLPVAPRAFTPGAPWPPALLLPAALAIAGLGVVGARSLEGGLRDLAFGSRQLVVVLTAAVVGVGLLAAIVRVGTGPYPGLERGARLVPAFVDADVDRIGPYRVVLLDVRDGVVHWDLVGAGGPSMVSYGTLRSPVLLDAVGDAVTGAVGGADPAAGTRLGLTGVRYVVVGADPGGGPDAGGDLGSPLEDGTLGQADLAEAGGAGEAGDTAGGAEEADPAQPDAVSGQDDATTAELTAALDQQAGLQPMPSEQAQVYRVTDWLPRAAVLPPDQADALLQRGQPGEVAEDRVLLPAGSGLYRGRVDAGEGSMLVVAEEPSPLWEARIGRTELPRADLPAAEPTDPDLPVNAFEIPAVTTPRDLARVVEARAAGGVTHRTVLALQALLALAMFSLALRPPRFARARSADARAGGLPGAYERGVRRPDYGPAEGEAGPAPGRESEPAPEPASGPASSGASAEPASRPAAGGPASGSPSDAAAGPAPGSTAGRVRP